MNGNARNLGGMLLLGLIMLGIGVVSVTTVQAAPQYGIDCTSCHTMPPTDAPTTGPKAGKKDPATGAVPGNHQGHASSVVASCAKCHGSAVVTYGTSHRNKVIDLSDTIGYSRKQAGVFLNQTSVPPNPLGSCSAASCHSDGKGHLAATPSWGRAPFQAPADCSQCHDTAPATGSHPVAGSKHAAYFGTGTDSCNRCHADHRGDLKPFAHATSAGGRGIDVHFTAAPNNGGTFASNQCSNLYCHSNGQTGGGRVTATPTWGGTVTCASCHGDAAGAASLSGKHANHVNNAAFLGTNYGCVDCHAATVSDNATIANRTDHVNGFVNLSSATVPRSAAAAGTVGSCSAVYCHSDGKGTFKTATWTGASTTLACNACHGSDTGPGSFASSTGMPNYSSAGAGAVRANSHRAHVSAVTDCVKCHDATVTGAGALTGSNHTNHAINVSGTQISYLSGSKTCSTNTCHSGGGIIQSVAAATWGGKLGCNGCHGDASTLASNAHAKHVNAATGKGYACETCHNLTVSGSSTIVNKNLHGDGTVEIAGSNVTSYSGVATKTCATSCHNTAAPQWNVAGSGACGTCHNALSTTANGLIATNAHTVHFTAAYGPSFDSTAATSCAVCHIYTTDTAATHVNGTVNLGAGFAKNGTCSTCHQQTTNWAGGTRVSCESCHTTTGGPLSVIGGVTAPDKTLAATAGHGSVGQQCTACHDNTTAHIGVAGGTSRLQATLGTGNAACTYCHSDPAKVTNTAKQITQVHVGFANACAVCHDPHGTANSKMVMGNLSSVGVSFSGTDFVNAQGTGVCQACHTGTAYYKRNVAETNHPSSGCLDCHAHKGFDGLTAFEPSRACDSCHGYPPAPRNVAVTFGVQNNWSSARFEDYSGGGGAHVVAAHLSKSIKPSDGFAPCLVCHNGGAATHAKALPLRNHVENVTVKIDPQYRFSNDSFAIYTGAKLFSGGANKTGSCFNVSCHFRPSPKWSTER